MIPFPPSMEHQNPPSQARPQGGNVRDEHPHEQPVNTSNTSSEARPPETRALAPPSGPDDRRHLTRSSETLDRYPAPPIASREERRSTLGLGVGAPFPFIPPQSPGGDPTRLRLDTTPPRPMPPPRAKTVDTHNSIGRSELDYIVPLEKVRILLCCLLYMLNISCSSCLVCIA